MKTYYALKKEKEFIFPIVRRTFDELISAINTEYWYWRGLKPKGSDATMEQYMAGKKIVKVTVEDV